MTLLAKIGGIIVKGLAILTGVAPIFQSAVPGASGTISTVTSDLTQISTIITEVEAMGQALAIKGPDKLKAAAPLVAQVILQSSLLVNHKIANQALFTQACTEIAGGMADLLNSLDSGNVSSQSKT